MTANATPSIVEATRMDGGVIVTFDDGKCAIYSAALLYAAYSNADQVDPEITLPVAE